ncbi:hypothetical protein PS2015_2959 [Pseudohongiella spirulinae]|uniref:Cell division protein FtsX n=2 Tax=Pseudohongiella spirulinae TaxID=1249552 RepID=A0A0S2KI25_9GAMM|nr:hypothetical protein PS2015_2959 [Pseudohongiella spirulinae]
MAKTDLPKGARRERSEKQKLAAWLDNHRHCAGQSLQRLREQPVATLMTLAVIGIALLLPALLYVSGKNLVQFSDSLANTNQISLYLADNATDNDVEAIEARFASNPQVRSIVYLSPDEAAIEFAQWSGLGDIVRAMETNPLPGTVIITPNDTRLETAEALVSIVRNMPGVERIQMDQSWASRLDRFVSLGQRLTWALITVLALAVLFITGNSIRSIIASSEAEIRVMNLIGATRSYIIRPFLYLGMWYGLLGGLLAWLLLQALLAFISQPANELLAFYGENYQFRGMDAVATALLIVGSAMLGWLGAKLSVSRHLRQYQ